MNLITRRPHLRSTLWLPHTSAPKKGDFLAAIGFNITGRKAAIMLALSGLLSLVYGVGQVSAATAPTINGLNPAAPLNVALVSDAVTQAEQVRAAAGKDTIAIIYQSDRMTPNGLADLLASVSAAHHGKRIGHLGIVAHGGPGELDLGKGNILSLATLPGQALALERLRSVLSSDARLDLYSCSVAAGTGGKAFIDELAAITGAAVFASDNPVGTVPGADFVWDYHTGQVNASKELLLVREMENIPQFCLAPQPFGTSLGSFNGVTTYSNYNPPTGVDFHNYGSGIFTGLKWQCVEYVQRYFYLQYGMNLYALSGGGLNAYQFFGAASTLGLAAYTNNSSTTAPQAGDILCFSGGSGGYGHVAIVRGTSSNERGQNELDLDIIEQNGTNDSSDAWFPLTYTVSGGVYNVSAAHLSSLLTVQGWLRKVATNQRPSIPSITTPTSTQSGNVTISYTLADPESDICGIAIQYSPDGGSNWYTATPGSGGDGTVPLTSSPTGTAHTFVWASGSDIVNTSNANVRFRITPVDAGGGGTPGTTGSYTISNATNHKPNTPTNILPANGAGNQPVTPTLIASSFSDQDSGDTQAATQWQVTRVSDGALVYDSGQIGAQTFCNVPSDMLANSTTYSWIVRYEDNHGMWGNYSTATSFTTVATPPLPPPTITSPGNTTSPGPILASNQPTFNWSAVPGAMSYILYVEDVTTGNSLGNFGIAAGQTQFQPSANFLPYSHSFCWWMTTLSDGPVESAQSSPRYFRTPTQALLPNLAIYQLESDKIVVSNTTGTTTDSSPLYTTHSLYLDFAWKNIGQGPAVGVFYTTVYVDGTFNTQWSNTGMDVGGVAWIADYNIGSLSAGTHTIQLVTDSTGAINESIESDNSYTKTITVIPPPISVTVQTSPSGLPITVDGTAYTAPQTFSWTSGSGHTIATTSPQSGGTGTQYAWGNWSDGGAMSHPVFPTVGTTYTANFTTQYYLSMSMGTSGNSVSPGSAWYNSGQIVSISATPYDGYSFNSWSGSGSGSYSGGSNSTSVTMNGPITETANFTGIVSTVTFNSQSGTTPNPATLNVTYGSTYGTLATTSRTGYTFGGWWTGTNGTGTQVTAVTTVAITSAQTLYAKWTTALQTWRQTWYGTEDNSGNAEDTADPYHTGIPNLLVFAFLGPNQNPALAKIIQLPQVQKSGGNLLFSFTQPTDVSGITYGAEWSQTLLSGSWTAVADTGKLPQHTFSVPVDTKTTLFMRLKVTSP